MAYEEKNKLILKKQKEVSSQGDGLNPSPCIVIMSRPREKEISLLPLERIVGIFSPDYYRRLRLAVSHP
jgi:hypothetical protein